MTIISDFAEVWCVFQGQVHIVLHKFSIQLLSNGKKVLSNLSSFMPSVCHSLTQMSNPIILSVTVWR